jgi:hypothetical protein
VYLSLSLQKGRHPRAAADAHRAEASMPCSRELSGRLERGCPGLSSRHRPTIYRAFYTQRRPCRFVLRPPFPTQRPCSFSSECMLPASLPSLTAQSSRPSFTTQCLSMFRPLVLPGFISVSSIFLLVLSSYCLLAHLPLLRRGDLTVIVHSAVTFMPAAV